jgi:hypothetical protein
MQTSDQPNGKSRWETAFDSTLALAQECEKIDPDGITIYLFSARFRRYDNVTSDKVLKIYEQNEPMGRTDLSTVLQDALNNYFTRKERGQTKTNGETILVITDGEPDNRKEIMRTVVEASKKIDRDEELAISFIQIGKDKKATEFLKALDDKLQKAGAKFDIVDTITADDIKGISLTDVLFKAITD